MNKLIIVIGVNFGENIQELINNTPKQPQGTKLLTGNTNTPESVIPKTNLSGHSNTINNNRYIHV